MSERIPFGAHAGEKIVDVVRDHPRYALWLCTLGESTWAKYPPAIYRQLRKLVAERLLEQVASETADRDRAARRREIANRLFPRRADDLL